MSHQQMEYFTRKRRREEDNENPMKQTKIATEPNIGSITFNTKLTDINDDCLEKVFLHLSFDDLLNVAHINKKLKTAADMVFAQKFGKKRFYFNINTSHRNEILGIQYDDIWINDLKTSLQLLRCYGHLISDLSISYDEKFRTAPIKVLHYTNFYCSETLKSIGFFNLFNYVFETSMKKPFLKIKKVFFSWCVLGKKISNLNKWFPAMQCLSLYYGRLTDPSSIEILFPQLEELYIPNEFNGKHFSPENVMAAFRSNPQLRKTSLNGLHFLKHLQGVSQFLPALEHLTIDNYSKNSFSPANFKSVKSLNICFIYNPNDQVLLPRINLSFDQLEEVEMHLEEYEIIDEAFEFFKKHQSITKLTLYSGADTVIINKERLMRIAITLPLLNEFNFMDELSADHVIYFLDEFKLVSQFSFYISDPDEFDHLKIKLGDEWQTSKNNSRIGLKRRT